MAPRSLLLTLLAITSSASFAGSWHSGSGPGLITRPTTATQISGRVKALVLTNRQGRRSSLPLPTPRDLAQGLPVPAGDWAELTVIFDGPVFLVGGGRGPLPLELKTLDVPLERPDAAEERRLFLDLSLPEGLVGAELLVAVADGVLAVDGER